MKKNFIKLLCESEIQNTELGLSVSSISDQLQSMIEKLTNIKTKDLTTIVKKIKYDNEIEKAQAFEDNIGGKLDELITSMSDTKGELDNEIVKLLNNEDIESDTLEDDDDTDLEKDFSDTDEEPTEDDEDFGDIANELGRDLK